MITVVIETFARCQLLSFLIFKFNYSCAETAKTFRIDCKFEKACCCYVWQCFSSAAVRTSSPTPIMSAIDWWSINDGKQ